MDILERIVNLSQARQCFAVATVVSRKAPVSSHLGDKAIILEEGTLEGFVGGACSREIVRKQALIALELQQPRLVRISPDATQKATSPDEICVPMTCASEGAVDVYIEPHMERKRMVVVGASPIARALIQQTALQGFDVTAICEADERHGLVGLEGSAQIIDLAEFEAWLSVLSKQQKGSLEAVVASMGHYDEETLALLVKANIRYLGLVSSQKRGQTVMALLADMELPATELARVHNPAGLDLGAKTPNEVALSIVAQIVQLRRQDVEAAKAARAALTSLTKSSCCSSSNKDEKIKSTEAIDPICNMTVDISTAKHTGEHDGTMYYFCCPNCKHKFLKEPDKYLKAA